jgi:hypothetical protein
MSSIPSAPPQLSPDGRFYWDGEAWKPYPTGPTGGPMVIAAAGQLGPRRNPFGYWVASLIVPGLGTMFAGRVWKGFCLFLVASAETGAIAVLANAVMSETTPASGLTLVISPNARQCAVAGCNAQTLALVALGLAFLLLGLWIYGIVDAVRSVHQWNRAHGYTH